MKITIQDIGPGEEEEIIVRCRDLDEALLRVIHEIKTRRGKFTVTDNDKIRSMREIFIISRPWTTKCFSIWNRMCLRSDTSCMR